MVRRSAERVFESLVDTLLAVEVKSLIREARVEVFTDDLIEEAAAPLIREVLNAHTWDRLQILLAVPTSLRIARPCSTCSQPCTRTAAVPQSSCATCGCSVCSFVRASRGSVASS